MKLFNIQKPIIGMIHLPALPGTPNNKLNPKEIIDAAIKEAEVLVANGIDALAIENMHDVPYLKQNIGPEIVSIMAIVAYELKRKISIPIGIQVLAGANKQALAIAYCSGIDFIRAEGFVYGHIADEGYIESCAGELLRFRKNIDANNVKIFTDIKKKHSSHLITADVDIVETSKAAMFFASDGLIITGNFTGIPPHEMDLNNVKKNTSLPVLIGSGINFDNVAQYLPLVDGIIIGSHFKVNDDWKNPIDGEKVKRFMEKVKTLRSN